MTKMEALYCDILLTTVCQIAGTCTESGVALGREGGGSWFGIVCQLRGQTCIRCMWIPPTPHMVILIHSFFFKEGKNVTEFHPPPPPPNCSVTFSGLTWHHCILPSLTKHTALPLHWVFYSGSEHILKQAQDKLNCLLSIVRWWYRLSKILRYCDIIFTIQFISWYHHYYIIHAFIIYCKREELHACPTKLSGEIIFSHMVVLSINQ